RLHPARKGLRYPGDHGGGDAPGRSSAPACDGAGEHGGDQGGGGREPGALDRFDAFGDAGSAPGPPLHGSHHRSQSPSPDLRGIPAGHAAQSSRGGIPAISPRAASRRGSAREAARQRRSGAKATQETSLLTPAAPCLLAGGEGGGSHRPLRVGSLTASSTRIYWRAFPTVAHREPP